jgi:UDP-N-acetylmuramoyl-L-alanyl-D-glutamate--2,6-diaminopimelate ligase
MERIECGQKFSVFVDGGRTPDGLAIALRTARQATSGRVICVIGARGHHGQDQRPLLGRVAERASDLFVVTSDNPRHEEPLQIAHDILDGVENPGRAHIIPSRDKAIAWALSQARPGDAVVIAGKGDRNYQRIGNRRLSWCDADVARDWLYNTDEPMILPFRRAA